MSRTKPASDPAPLLGEFIRAHRERLAPERVGLPRGLRRRAKGLRREELAQLCGISPTWLTWIEQGRAVSLSARTLDGLARALAMTAAERGYLFDLAGLRDPAGARAAPAVGAAAQHEALQAAVASIRSPAYGLDRDWTAVAWNRPASLLFSGWLGRAAPTRNLLEYTFLDVGARRFIDDWQGRARRLVAEFRADRSASLREPETRRQVERLRRASVDFDAIWREQNVLGREGGERVFQHPVRGRVAYRQLSFRTAGDDGSKLVILV